MHIKHLHQTSATLPYNSVVYPVNLSFY